MLRIKINIDPAQRTSRRIQQRLRNFRPLFVRVEQRALIRSIVQVFRTNGYGTWPPTQRTNPILRDTRALFRSYTQVGARGNISRISRRRLVWGSSLPYAEIHEYGTRNIEARPVLRLALANRRTRGNITRVAENWVDETIRGSSSDR